MSPTQHQEIFPRELNRELQSWTGRTFERRTVVVRDEATGGWTLLGCVLKPLAVDVPPDVTLDYGKALFRADWIAAADLRVFLAKLTDNLCDLTGKTISTQFWPSCTRQLLPLQSDWMEQPGVAWTWSAKEQPNPALEPLLRADAPYYPDVHEAAKQWLGLRRYFGHSDSRRGSLTLLLPEMRAFISDFSWSDDHEHLRLQLGGSATASGGVLVKGAYWRGDAFSHIDYPVEGAAVTLRLPQDVTKLDLLLVGTDGTVYEQHKEALGWADQRFLGRRHSKSSGRVVDALEKGEGPHIEFKPFIQLPKFKAGLKPDARHKLEEVLETIAAFSNAEGGTIFLGIANDFRVVGISDGLRQWAEGEPTREALDAYLGALRAQLQDGMQLPVDVRVSAVEHEDRSIVLVDVPRSEAAVSVKDKGIFWRRVGAGNRRVPPDEWASRKPDAPF